MTMTEHRLMVPLDYAAPDRGSLTVFAREVVANANVDKALPWLLFLQGGPGSPAPRPVTMDGWLGHALKSHRVVLMDQRGTGQSSAVTAHSVDGMDPARLAARLRCLRADSIVADAERLRTVITGGAPWDTLGQSYGGFLTLSYLSMAPEGLRTCYVTGGLPGITATAADVYARTYPRVAAKNREFYQRHPSDVDTVRAIADYLEGADVRLPDGDRLTLARFRVLGQDLGMKHGADRLHWLLETGWDGRDLSDTFRYHVMVETGFIDNPLFALQEYIYGQANRTAWAAQHAMAKHPEFAAGATPLLFTGEMMYPWMFSDIAALRPFAGAADLLAETDDWAALYDSARLAANTVPVAAAVYFDDMYVDSGLQLETANQIGNTRVWVTNEYEHDGIRQSGERVLSALMDLVANT
jgi:pimeloyl-ACP methyl ester carboxylesterase